MNEIESGMLRSAARSGMTDENQLANLIFFRRHPERNGRLISRTEPNFQQLSQEWLNIRDTLVRPVLRGTTPVPRAPSTPTGHSPSSSAAAGMASSIFSVRFTHDPPSPTPDHSLPRPGPAGSGPDRAGYTTAPLKPHISIVWGQHRPTADGRLPLFVRSVKVSYHLGPLKVFVSSNYAVNSCPYRVTLDHEKSHTRAFVQIFRAARKILVQDLKGIDVPTRVTPELVTSTKEAENLQKNIDKRVKQAVSVHFQSLVGAMMADRNAKDSAAAYRAVYAKCPANTW